MGLSTHILDTSSGKPAASVSLLLSQQNGDTWTDLGRGMTDSDGRCRTLLGEHPLESGTYKIRFDTASYYASQQVSGLYPCVEIVFIVRDAAEHYHIPLLLTANGYSTYRGS